MWTVDYKLRFFLEYCYMSNIVKGESGVDSPATDSQWSLTCLNHNQYVLAKMLHLPRRWLINRPGKSWTLKNHFKWCNHLLDPKLLIPVTYYFGDVIAGPGAPKESHACGSSNQKILSHGCKVLMLEKRKLITKLHIKGQHK